MAMAASPAWPVADAPAVAFERELDSPGMRLRGALRDRLGRDAMQVEGRGRLAPGAVLQAREGEELLDDAGRALGRREGARKRVVAPRGVGRALRHLELRARGRQRRAQLVRRVAGEAALAVEGGLDARQQRVEPRDERRDLGRDVAFQGRQVLRVAARDLVAHARERRERAAHGEPHEQGEERQRHRRGARPARPTISTMTSRRSSMASRTCTRCSRFASHRLNTRQSRPSIATVEKPASCAREAACRANPRSAAGASRRRFHTWKDRRLAYLCSVGACSVSISSTSSPSAHHEQRGVLREVGVEDLLHLVVGLDHGGHGGGDPDDREPRQQDREEAPANAAANGAHARSLGIT